MLFAMLFAMLCTRFFQIFIFKAILWHLKRKKISVSHQHRPNVAHLDFLIGVHKKCGKNYNSKTSVFWKRWGMTSVQGKTLLETCSLSMKIFKQINKHINTQYAKLCTFLSINILDIAIDWDTHWRYWKILII